ncbi:MAG TPA: hypothetical protein VLN49_08235 [Gemmatimonadaceae bacterium]|nr:hypothetical protein [Gemmatimonadaceae bacterium]
MPSSRRVVVVALGLLALASASVRAQHQSPVHTGGWIISGSGSLGRSHTDASDADVTHIGIRPTALVFLTNRFALGASLPVSYSRLSNPSSHIYSYGLGPAARYYFVADTSRWLSFVAASVEPQWQKQSSQNVVVASPGGVVSTETFDSSNRLLTIDGSLGLTRLLAEHVGLTGELYYTHSELSGDVSPRESLKSYDVGARFGLTVFVH